MPKIPCGITFNGKKYTPEQFMAKLMEEDMAEFVYPAKAEVKEVKTEITISDRAVADLIELKKQQPYLSYSGVAQLKEFTDKHGDVFPQGVEQREAEKLFESAFAKKLLEGELPKKAFAKNEKIDVENLPEGEINVQPIDTKVKIETDKAKSLKDIVSDDDLRPNMTGVFYDAENGVMVATDSHKLVVMPDKTIKKTEIIHPKTGEKIDGRYPDYKAVIPQEQPYHEKINTQKWLNEVSGLAKTGKFVTEAIRAKIKIGDTDFTFNPQMLKDVLDVFARNGVKEIDMSLDMPNRAMVLKGNGITALVMPEIINEERYRYKTLLSREKTQKEIAHFEEIEYKREKQQIERSIRLSKEGLSEKQKEKTKLAKRGESTRYEDGWIKDEQERLAEYEKQLKDLEDGRKSRQSIAEQRPTKLVRKQRKDTSESVVENLERQAESDSETKLNEVVKKADEIVGAEKIAEKEAESTESPIGKTITFPFAGSETKGVVKSIDEKGNYKVVEKDGTKHTVKPEDAKIKEPTAVEKAEQELKDALKDLGDASDITKLGVKGADPEKQAEAMYRVHKALVKLAKEYIAKGIADVKDFAKKVGVSAKNAQQAWDEAMGAIKHTKDTIEYDMADIAKTAIRRGINVREKFAAYKEKAKDISEAITKFMEDKELRGSLSAREISSLVKRAANVKTDKQLDKFIDYAEKVIDNANYVEEMDAVRGMQKAAQKRKHLSYTDIVKEFTSINPEALPEDKVLAYKMALDDLMSRTPSYKKMAELYYDVVASKISKDNYSNIEKFEQAQELYDKIGMNDVKSIEDYRALFGDINAFKRRVDELFERGDITGEEHSDLMAQVGKDQKAIEEKYAPQITSIKTDFVNEINAKKKDLNLDGATPEEKKLVERFMDLDNNQLRNLSPEELYNLSSIMDNLIGEGNVDVMRLSSLVDKAEVAGEAVELSQQVNKGKSFLKMFDSISDAVKILSQEYSSAWESVLGLGSVEYGAMQHYVISPLERALGAYRRATQDGYKYFLNAKKKYNITSGEQMDKIGMIATYLREYGLKNNPKTKDKTDKKGNAFGDRDWVEHMITDENEVAALGAKRVEELRKIWNALPKKDGKVNPEEVFDSFDKGDTKYLTANEMAFLKDVMDWRQNNTATKQKYSNEIRGKSLDNILFHIKRIRKDNKSVSGGAPVEVSEGKSNIRLAAGSGKEVKTDELGAIETNFEKIFAETLEENMRDYHATPVLQKLNKLLNATKEGVDKDKQAYVDAMKDNAVDALNNEFANTQMNELGKVATRLMRAQAAKVLIAPARTVVELVSALGSYPARAKALSAYVEVFKKRDAVSRLMTQTESPYLNRVDLSRQFDVEKTGISQEGRLQKASELFGALPERLGIEPVWMAVFEKSFKKQTGKDFDRDKYLGNSVYEKQYRKEIKNAASDADGTYGQIAGATTRAAQRRNIRILPERVAKAFGFPSSIKADSTGGRFAAFMTGYPYRDVETILRFGRAAKQSLTDAAYTKSDVAMTALPVAGVLASALLYNYGSQLNYIFSRMITGDDEEKEKAKKELDDLHSPKGLLVESAGALTQTLSARYSGLSRAAITVFSSMVYNLTDDKETKKLANNINRNITFQNPIELKMKKDGTVSRFGLDGDILKVATSWMPAVSAGVANAADAAEAFGGVNKLYEKVEKGEVLSEPEKDILLSLYITINMSNAITQFAGYALPTTTLNRMAKDIMSEKKEDANKLPTLQLKQLQKKELQKAPTNNPSNPFF